MNVSSLTMRRTIVLAAAVAAVALGFAAIQVAAAWTAQAAPLTANPAAATSIEARLADEQARSAALQVELDSLIGNADHLSAALAAAQDQIQTDNAHAAQLEQDLANATKKLEDLQRSIKAAAARTVVTRTLVTAAPSERGRASEHDDDDGEHDDG